MSSKHTRPYNKLSLIWRVSWVAFVAWLDSRSTSVLFQLPKQSIILYIIWSELNPIAKIKYMEPIDFDLRAIYADHHPFNFLINNHLHTITSPTSFKHNSSNFFLTKSRSFLFLLSCNSWKSWSMIPLKRCRVFI